MRLDPRMLRQFLAVCREGTISGAAKVEHVSQPSISMAMSQLERVLDIKLFERNPKGISLTAAGEALRLKAIAVESLLVTAQDEIKLLAEKINGPLHIGGTPGALASVMGRVITSFCEEFPHFRLKLTECHEETAHRLLKAYDMDIAILTTGMSNSPDDFCEQPIFSDSFALMVGRANADMPQSVHLSELTEARWLMPDKIGGFKHQINALFLNNQLSPPTNVIFTDSILTSKRILIHSDYIAILPTEVVKSELANGMLRAINIENVQSRRKVGLLWLAERELSPFAKAFIEHATKYDYV